MSIIKGFEGGAEIYTVSKIRFTVSLPVVVDGVVVCSGIDGSIVDVVGSGVDESVVDVVSFGVDDSGLDVVGSDVDG